MTQPWIGIEKGFYMTSMFISTLEDNTSSTEV